MSELFKDGFDHYGLGATGIANMAQGAWAAPGSIGAAFGAITPPAWGAATGIGCLAVSASGQANSQLNRRVLPTAATTLIAGFRFSQSSLPGAGVRTLIAFHDSGNNHICSINCTTTGALTFVQGGTTPANGTVAAQTNGPVLVAGSWQHVEAKVKIDAAVGSVEIRVDKVVVLNVLGINSGAVACAQVNLGWATNTVTGSTAYWDDLIVRDNTGTRNNDFEGDLRVATLYPNADATAQGWTPRPRKKFGTGILDNRAANNSGVTAASSTSTDLGSGDYTLEQFVRFFALPTGSTKAVIINKWDETNNKRSYQLYLGGPSLEAGNLVFRTSTDGLAGSVQEVISWPWVPDLNVWYHLAISRAAGETMLFVNGVQLGMPVADARTYFAGTELLGLGVQAENTASTIANTAFPGFMDEVRMTVGYARYNAPFTPPAAAFPRNVAGDPHFANVALLCGFDSGINDESSFGRILTARSGSVQNTPDDGVYAFQTINQTAPRDDTFIEASLLQATGTYTLTALPANGETVTVGTKDGAAAAVYTFKTALASAFDVKIGADVPTTLANLVAAINHAAGEGTVYGTGTTANFDVAATQLPGTQIMVTAITAGTGGNAIASTTTAANGSWGGATLSGGANIPGPSEFYFQRPPNNTTVINSLTIVNRSSKSDSGTCAVQASFIGPNGTVANGAVKAPAVNPTYYEDIFDTDPDTGNGLTPTTIVSGRVRLNRTA